MRLARIARVALGWWREFFHSASYPVLEAVEPQVIELQVDFIVRELRLAPGVHVLDIACGIGRHALALARRGLRVTGLDYSTSFLAHARSEAEAHGLAVELVRGDMRALPFRDQSFDAAVCLSNCLGYFESERDDERTLAGIARVLRPDAPFLLDVLHRDGFARRFTDVRVERFDGSRVIEHRTWDPRRGRIRSEWSVIRDREDRDERHVVDNRIYTYGELERMLTAVGFAVDQAWGNWAAAPLTIDSEAMIVRSRCAHRSTPSG